MTTLYYIVVMLMMRLKNVSVRLDDRLHKRMMEVVRELGLSKSAFITLAIYDAVTNSNVVRNKTKIVKKGECHV